MSGVNGQFSPLQKNSPILKPPYTQNDNNRSHPTVNDFALMTEGGSFILNESGDFLTTE
jgi:hypothetical protein